MNAGPTYAGGPARRTARITAIAVLALVFLEGTALASDSGASVPLVIAASTEVGTSSTTTAAADGTVTTTTTTTTTSSTGADTSNVAAAGTGAGTSKVTTAGATAPVTSPAAGAPAAVEPATPRSAPTDASPQITSAPAPDAETAVLPAGDGTSSKSSKTPAASTKGGDKSTLPDDATASAKNGERSTAPPVRTRRSDRPRSARVASPIRDPAGVGGGRRPAQTTPAPDPRIPAEGRPATDGLPADRDATTSSPGAAGPATPAAGPVPAPSATSGTPAASYPLAVPPPDVFTPPAPASLAPAPLAATAHPPFPDFTALRAPHAHAAAGDAEPAGAPTRWPGPSGGDPAAHPQPGAPMTAWASAPPSPQHAVAGTTRTDTRREASSRPPSAPPAPREAPVSPPIPTGTGADGALGGVSSPTGAPVIALLFAAATLVAASPWRPIGTREARLPQILAGMAIERPG
jgi:hypothetical protein